MFFEGEQPARPWMDAKETAKLLAWNRQELISNELSRLAADEYLEDIMLHLRHMEVRFSPLQSALAFRFSYFGGSFELRCFQSRRCAMSRMAYLSVGD